SPSLGAGFTSSSACAASSIPGVQKPHWRPCFAWKARWIGWSSPSGARLATVAMSAPWAWTARTRQESVSRPSSQTAHVPQPPCSHATCTPVRPSSCRRKSARSSRGSARPLRRVPSTRIVTARGSGTSAPRLLDRPPHEHRGDPSPVSGVCMDVADGLQITRRERRDLGGVYSLVQRALGLARPLVAAAEAEEDDAGGSQEHGRARECEVAVTTRELREAEGARTLARQDDGRQQLIHGERGREG